MILKDIDPSMTIQELMDIVKKRIGEEQAFKVYRNLELDTLMVYFKAHETKTQNLIINFNQKFLDKQSRIDQNDIENETELSLFNQKDFLAYKSNPEIKW